MSWKAAEMEFERELKSRDGQVAKVWLRPWSGAERRAMQNRAQETDAAGTLGDFKRDQLIASLIRWDLPFPATTEGLDELDNYVYDQLEDLVDEVNTAAGQATLPAEEAAPADPLNGSTGSPDGSSEKRPELVPS